MNEERGGPAAVDEYIAGCPPGVQPILQKIRSVIREAAPQAEEGIGYGMPGFYLKGALVWYNAHTRHIGFYPTGEGIAAFQDQLAGYKTSKGAVQFPLSDPIPYDLITAIVRHRVEQNLQPKRGAGRKG